MKKLLSILAAVGLTATASTSVVACTQSVKKLNLTVKMSDEGIWGKKAHLISTDVADWAKANNKTAPTEGAETLANFLSSTKASKDTKKMAKSIKKNLDLKDWIDDDGEPSMQSFYFSAKPSFKSGSKHAHADIEKLRANAIINPSATTIKAGTYYILAWNKAKNADKTQKVLVIKVTFQAK